MITSVFSSPGPTSPAEALSVTRAFNVVTEVREEPPTPSEPPPPPTRAPWALPAFSLALLLSFRGAAPPALVVVVFLGLLIGVALVDAVSGALVLRASVARERDRIAEAEARRAWEEAVAQSTWGKTLGHIPDTKESA